MRNQAIIKLLYMIRKKFKNLLFHPVLFLQLLSSVIKKKFIPIYERKAIDFFKSKDIYKYFVSGHKDEYTFELIDLKNIFELITSRKPKCVLEFGVGFSTICITLALKENEKNGFFGHLYTVDADKFWIKNTENKFPSDLKKYVTFHYSPCSVSTVNHQLVSTFDILPNISPNFIYLDGPNTESVRGKIRGLSFGEKIPDPRSDRMIKTREGNMLNRRIVASDILLYESSSPSDFFVLVDRRYVNTNFLINNLKYKYTLKKDLAFGIVTFERKYQPYP